MAAAPANAPAELETNSSFAGVCISEDSPESEICFLASFVQEKQFVFFENLDLEDLLFRRNSKRLV
jgi:hypothetical protein